MLWSRIVLIRLWNLGRKNDAALAAPITSLWLYDFLKKFGDVWSVLWKKLGTDFKSIMIVRKITCLKSGQCFVKEDKTSLKFLGHFALFVQKIWDVLSVPKGYSVLGTLCPKASSVAGTLQPGTECPRTFRPLTFRQGTIRIRTRTFFSDTDSDSVKTFWLSRIRIHNTDDMWYKQQTKGNSLPWRLGK
jgi:hypothetical protein